MEGVILVNVLHVVIAYPLIYGKFGLPQLGVTGAAYAINASEFCGCLYLLIQALRQGYLRVGKPDMLLFGKIWQVGYPVALERVAQQSGQLFYSKFIIAFGTAAYAAHQTPFDRVIVVHAGSGDGYCRRNSDGSGPRRAEGSSRTAQPSKALRVAIMVMASMALLFLFAPHLLIGLFTHDPEVIDKGCLFLRLVAFAQVPLAISFVYAGSLRGTGDTHYVFLVTLFAMWGIRVFLSWVAVTWLHLTLPFVWGVFLIDWYFRATLFAWRYRSATYTR